MYEGEYLPPSVYERVRDRVRKETLAGLEPPRLTQAEILICEVLGDLERKINNLAARIEQISREGFRK